jgi:methylenetetrahydrofolate reductase (NADPH)
MELVGEAPRMTEPRSELHRLLLAGEFVVTAELETTDSADPASVAELAAHLRGRVDAVNCTDNSAAHPHLAALAAAHLLADAGVEPVMQLTCRDRNRLALQADLLGAAALGIPNILCMTGDDVTAGDHPEAKPIFDIDSLHLLRIARIMRDEGRYLSGRPLAQPPSFLVGAVENPFAPPFEFRPMRLGKKVEAGAEFIQTQICFNLEKMRLFMARCGDLGFDHAG